MKLIDKTIDLMEYTYRETSRKDRFPIKYRTIIFERQTNSLNIYKMLLTANKLPICGNGSERQLLQLKAVALCDDLSGLIELANKLTIISIDKMGKWQAYLTPVKNMILAWIKSDSKR